MQKHLFLIIICLTSLSGYSQIKFEPGYIIDNSGIRKDVLIKNRDWRNNPLEISYKNSSASEELTATISEIKGFAVGEHLFERATVEVDQSSERTAKLSQRRNPEFVEKTVFLRKLVEGPATLYEYKNKNYGYFYKVGDAPVRQLIYKKYLRSGKIAENSRFRQQLWKDLVCEEMHLNRVEKLNYNSGDLIRYFNLYNTCADSSFQPAQREKGKPEFNFNLKGGIDVASLSVERGLNAKGTEINGIGYRAGFEFEYILPFNKNKWGIHLEPNYRYFASQAEVARNYTSANLDVTYSSLEIGVGAKHYMFLNSRSKFFITASYVADIKINSRIIFLDTGLNMDPELTSFDFRGNLVLGLGYNFEKKYIIELKYGFPRELNGYRLIPESYLLDWRSNYSYLSVMVGYSLF